MLAPTSISVMRTRSEVIPQAPGSGAGPVPPDPEPAPELAPELPPEPPLAEVPPALDAPPEVELEPPLAEVPSTAPPPLPPVAALPFEPGSPEPQATTSHAGIERVRRARGHRPATPPTHEPVPPPGAAPHRKEAPEVRSRACVTGRDERGAAGSDLPVTPEAAKGLRRAPHRGPNLL